MISSVLGADGRGNELLYIPAGGSGLPASFETVSKGKHFIKMNGREVFKWAVRVLAEVTKKAVSEEGLVLEDIDYFIFHQANKRIIDAVSKSLNIPPEKMVVNIERVGNTSTASIPLALEDLRKEKGLKKGDLLLLASFGAGLTWGANIVRWSKEGS